MHIKVAEMKINVIKGRRVKILSRTTIKLRKLDDLNETDFFK